MSGQREELEEEARRVLEQAEFLWGKNEEWWYGRNKEHLVKLMVDFALKMRSGSE